MTIAMNQDVNSLLQLIRDGIDIVKQLYHSKDNHIKVRALVAMCKMGEYFMSGVEMNISVTPLYFKVPRPDTTLPSDPLQTGPP